MPPKAAVLILLNHYLPGYRCGGPIRSIANLVESLGDEFDFKVIAENYDYHGKDPYQGIKTGEWVQCGKAQVQYLPPGPGAYARYYRLLRSVKPDVLYVNSVLNRRYSFWPLLLYRLSLIKPGAVVVAPRGEFSPGALHLKRRQKRFYLAVASRLGIHKNVHWQGSTSLEVEHIERLFGSHLHFDDGRPAALVARNSPCIVARDVPKVHAPDAALLERSRKIPGVLDLVFLSRVSEKKNLDGALRMLAGLSGNVPCFQTDGSQCEQTQGDAAL